MATSVTSPVTLSVIIVSWNVRHLLGQCLASVVRDPIGEASEVLVVDNASHDGSAEMVRAEHPQVRVIQNCKNVGFARANNQAIRASRGKYVVLLNPDTVVLDGALSRLVEIMEQHPTVGAIGPRLLNGDGSLQHGSYPMPTVGREFWRLFYLDTLWPIGVYPMERWSTQQPREVDVVSGACLLLRRDALCQVGLLSEDYFMYSEEVDLCRRLQLAYWKLMWFPQARVIHYGGQSTTQMEDVMFLQLYRSKVVFLRQHDGRGSARLYKAVLSLASLARIALAPLAWLESPTTRRKTLKLAHQYRLLVANLRSM